MISLKISPLLAVILSVAPAFSQTFDSSGNASLSGNYFVREVLITGQNTNGTIKSAASAIGTVAFDGKGNFTFTGQGMNSSSGANANLTFTGTYHLAANGLLQMTSLVDHTDVDYGGVSPLGPSAFVASATEGSNVSILVGVPAGSNVNNGAFRGSYSAGYIDFLNADISMLRQANFRATADGAGGLGTISVAGNAANLAGTATTQTVSGVTYSLSGQGAGTVTFGAASTAQLISGPKNLYISSDQNIVLGGSPTGYDLFVGIKSLTGTASNSTISGDYYIAGLENFAGTNQQGNNGIDGFYGSVNATGTGTALYHNRFQSFSDNVYDYTFDSYYSVNSDGTFAPADLPYKFTLGNNGQAFVATGTGSLYSLMVGFGTQHYQGNGVFLNPLGVVNAASFSPITNPIAPNEYVALYGSGLASSTVQAQSLPLPTTLGNVSVTVNGIAAPLFYVSPSQIAILVPSSIYPDNGVYYATVQVTNNGVKSNPVTVYTSNTAPGVFSQGGNGIGPAAAQRSDYSLLTSKNPAKAGDSVILYLDGLGSVTPAVADGAAASGTALSKVNAATYVDFGSTNGTVSFAGLTPGLAGLYQMNVVVPTGTGSTGDYYVNVSTPDAYTSQSTINIASGSALQGATALSTKPLLSNLPAARRRALPATRPAKPQSLMMMRQTGMGR